jgi:hypothetical protein
MRSRTRLAIIALGFALSVPGLGKAAPLVMVCHELVHGAPDSEGSEFVLDGDVLTNHTSGQVVFLSSSKLSLLTPYAYGRSTWSRHTVEGHKVRREVLWKDRNGKTVRVFHDLYDFDAKTVRGDLSGDGDACHHSGP